MTIQELIEILEEARIEADENDFYITDSDGNEICSLREKYGEIIDLVKQILITA